MRVAPAPVCTAMLATLHRAPILAAVGLFAAVLARTPHHAAAAAQPAGCPVPAASIVIPAPVLAPARLIYISNPDSPPDRDLSLH
jgi:hypothetical protein